MNKERQDGYYWVKLRDKWVIAEYNHNYDCWGTVGNEQIYYNESFSEIIETPIQPPNKINNKMSMPICLVKIDKTKADFAKCLSIQHLLELKGYNAIVRDMELQNNDDGVEVEIFYNNSDAIEVDKLKNIIINGLQNLTKNNKNYSND